MTAPKLAQSRGGFRYYEFEDGIKHPGVTTLLSMLPAPWKAPWYASQAAIFALQNIDAVKDIASRDEKAAVDMIKNAARRNTGAADTGTMVHQWFEARLNRTALPEISDEARQFIKPLNAFMAAWKPRPLLTEATVRSDSVGYGGSLDCVVEMLGETIIMDLKTGKSVHAESAAQLASYRYADYLADFSALPKITGAAVLHVRPNGYSVIPVKADEETFKIMPHLRAVFRWEEEKRGLVGKPLELPVAD